MLNMELGSKWQTILELTQKQLPPQLWEMTIHSGLLPLQLLDNTLQLGVMQSFIKNYIEQNDIIRKVLLDAVHQIMGPSINVDIIDMGMGMPTSYEETSQLDQNSLETNTPKPNEFENQEYIKPIYQDPVIISPNKPSQQRQYPSIPNPQGQESPEKFTRDAHHTTNDVDLSQSSLNPDYTFANFISGNSTRVAFSLAQSVAESPSTLYNPLFIYGESGLGKTHLMHAIGNDILQRYPDKKVMCITSEALMNSFIKSIRDKNPETFRNTFRNIDVLLVDDIQFFDNKESTQEEFFHTFNVLKNDNKQIVLTSDTMPQDMKSLTDRLRTRFMEGAVTTIDPPDREMRTAILQSIIEHKKHQFPQLHIDHEAIEFIVISFKDNIRSLKGALNSLLSMAVGEGRIHTIDLAFTQKALNNLLPDSNRVYLTIEGIQNFIASYFSIKKTDLLGSKRNKQFVVPRQIAMYLCRELINESFPQIGSSFGKDHTTILHAYTKVTKELEKDPALRDTLEDIKEKIKTSV